MEETEEKKIEKKPRLLDLSQGPLPKRTLVLLAIFLTVSLIFFLSLPALRSLTPGPELAVSTTPLQKPLFLSLASPADGDVILGSEIMVKGKTLPNVTVLFFTETDENSVESDENGNFSGSLNLSNGINPLTVVAISRKGEEKTLNLNVVYDEEAGEEQVKGVKAEEEPPGQVKKEAEAAQKAIIGNVDEVTDDSLTIKEKKSNKRVTTRVDRETKIIGQDKKALRLNSLRPEDLTAIITDEVPEATEGAKLKKAIKIFVRPASAVAQKKRRAVHGIITSASEGLITLVHQIHRERTYRLLYTGATIIKIKGVVEGTSADLEVGLRIAAVGDLDEGGNLVAKRIHIIPGKTTAPASPTVTATPEATPSATPTLTPTLIPQ